MSMCLKHVGFTVFPIITGVPCHVSAQKTVYLPSDTIPLEYFSSQSANDIDNKEENTILSCQC